MAENESVKPKLSPVLKVTVNGIDFDCTSVLPFKIKDWRELQAKGVDVSKYDGSIASMAIIAQYLLKRTRPEIPDDFVDGLTLTQTSEIARMVTEAEEAGVDRPT